MRTMTMIEAIEYIEQHDDMNFAFRGDDFIPVKKFRPSRYHGDMEIADRRIHGVSSIGIPAQCDREELAFRACLARQYGENVFLLQGNLGEYGDDLHEYVLNNHKIVAVIKKDEFKLKAHLPHSDCLEHPFELSYPLPAREEEVEEPESKMSYEEWSVKAFKKVWPQEGIFAAQYERYLNN